MATVDARIVHKLSDECLLGIKFQEEEVRDAELNGFYLIVLGLFYHFVLDDQVSILARAPIGCYYDSGGSNAYFYKTIKN